MRSQRVLNVLIVMAVVVACAVQAGGQNPPPAKTGSKEPPVAGQTPAEPKELRELEIRHAKVYAQLAQLNLQAAEELNAKVPGTLSVPYIDRLRELVFVANGRLKALESNGPPGNLRLVVAQSELNIAEGNLQRGIDINQRVPGAVSGHGIERLKLTVELAQINVQRARIESPSPLVDLKWELDRLHEDVTELRTKIENITSRR